VASPPLFVDSLAYENKLLYFHINDLLLECIYITFIYNIELFFKILFMYNKLFLNILFMYNNLFFKYIVYAQQIVFLNILFMYNKLFFKCIVYVQQIVF
jgi:hypothetical protein